MPSTARLILAVAVVTLTAGAVGAQLWRPAPFAAPFLMGFMRPRRAPQPARPPPGVGGVMAGGPGGPAAVGPVYPPRALTFSGYFTGSGAPQASDPYAFGWAPAFRSAESEEAPADGPPPTPAVYLEPATDSPTLPPTAPPTAPPTTLAPAADEAPLDDADALFAARAKPGPGKNNKPPRPSYPVPDGPSPAPQPTPPQQQPGQSGGGSDRDNGGYGTINAYFPFTFSGGWPGPAPEGPRRPPSPRGYGAPSPPSYGGGNGGSGGNGGNGGNGGGSGNGGNGGSGGNGGNGGGSSNPWGQQQPGPAAGGDGANGASGGSGAGGWPYSPVAIANSFSVGKNAMASSTATAYGAPPPSRQ